MNRTALITLCAIGIFIPSLVNGAAAQTLVSGAITSKIVTDAHVLYEATATAQNGFTTARLWSDATLTEAASDCSARNGALTTCSAACGLNGCFSNCVLACEFPEKQKEERDELIAQYTKLQSEIGTDTSRGMLTARNSGKSEREAKKELASLSERLKKMSSDLKSEIALLNRAALEWREHGYGVNPIPGAAKQLSLIQTSLATKDTDAFSKNCGVLQNAGGAKGTVAIDRLSANGAALITARCDIFSDDVTVTFGTGESNQIIYEKAYAIVKGKWQPITLSGEKSGEWLTGSAIASLTKDKNLDGVAMYMCQNVSGTFKCGCQDASCVAPKWQTIAIEK